MARNIETERPPEWLALHFPQLTDDPDHQPRQVDGHDLERIAAWCYQYSSQVCIVQRHNGVLLETAASRRLFGDAAELTERVTTELRQLGYRVVSGIAPTPEGAHLAARHGRRIRTARELRNSVAGFGIDDLHLQAGHVETLHKMGFTRVAEILRLPRKALTRRLGPALVDYLDRLLGHRPDPCKTFRPADGFSAGIDIAETTGSRGLVFPLRRLLQELCGVLDAFDRGIQALRIDLRTENGTETIRLALQRVTRSESHLVMLLRERLERLRLTGPVHHIHLAAPKFLPCAVLQPGLLKDEDTTAEETIGPLLERLQARLGRDALMGVTGRQDHRPEFSWSLRKPGEPSDCTSLPRRPAWLFPEPRRCRIENYRILAGPERIETGWWDGRDYRRDYFVVRAADGGTLWAFHEYKPSPGWYLHGLFS